MLIVLCSTKLRMLYICPKTVMSDILLDIQYDPEQNNYIYSFRMSEQKKCDLEKRLQSYGATLEEAIPNYLQAVMDQEDKNTCP